MAVKKVTLAQIAEKTGFSINAVSKALNDKNDISEATKRKIKQAAKELGYITNHSARSLRSGKTNTIGIIISDMFNPYYSNICNEIEFCMSAFGYSIIMLNSNNSIDKEYVSVVTAIGKGVDGVIICPVDTDTPALQQLIKSNIPFISIEKYITYPDSGYVIRDDTRGGFIAVEHLITLGHTNILFIMNNEQSYCTQQRLDGIRGAFLSYGIPYDENQVYFIGSKLEEMHDKITGILDSKAFSAVVCSDDIIALQVSYMLIKLGYNIPNDISIVGFGDYQSQITCYPMLTTVTVPVNNISIEAAQILIAKINGEKINDKIILPVELLKRESTAPPPLKSYNDFSNM